MFCNDWEYGIFFVCKMLISVLLSSGLSAAEVSASFGNPKAFKWSPTKEGAER